MTVDLLRSVDETSRQVTSVSILHAAGMLPLRPARRHSCLNKAGNQLEVGTSAATLLPSQGNRRVNCLLFVFGERCRTQIWRAPEKKDIPAGASPSTRRRVAGSARAPIKLSEKTCLSTVQRLETDAVTDLTPGVWSHVRLKRSKNNRRPNYASPYAECRLGVSERERVALYTIQLLNTIRTSTDPNKKSHLIRIRTTGAKPLPT
ncbi:hypothetical protein J6590_032963 [Homalodisca vitripennis]|nr:hypothetical protein J6590_032963 [Homalodisca vitripennis]